VLVEEPAYEPLVRIAEGVGARVVRFARASSERFAIDPQRIAEAMTSRVRLVAVTDLHNPSGVRASDDVLREAARIVGERGAYLLVDEVYGAFDALVAPSGTFGRSARKLAPNIVAISSLTKCYGLGPERIGWLLGPADAICRARDAITASCGMLPLSHSHIALRAFANISVLAARSRAILAGKREIVRGWVESLGLSWSAPREGLFCLVSVTGSDDLTPVIEAAARERDVLVVPGTFFGAPSSFRLAWSAPVEVLEEGLGRLAEALRQARLTGRC
jgi:aspartate/methionine/tyrosine aminotransferase